MTDEKKKSPAEQAVMDKLVLVYQAATAEDKAKVENLVRRAMGSGKASDIVATSPGMAVTLFFDHNRQNREWSHNSTLDYLRQMEADEWEFTCQGIGFLTSGDVGDGQHRLAAIALSGRTIDVLVAFGMQPKAIVALDTGRRRQASDYVHIMHPSADTKVIRRKQQIIKRTYAKLAQNPDENQGRAYVLKTNRDVAKAIEQHDSLLNQALDIGDDSVKGRAKPTVPAIEAAVVAFTFLLRGGEWTIDRIVTDLNALQSGEDREGNNSPLFVVADQLQKDAVKRERATANARLNAVIKAFLLHEQGIKAVRVSDIRAAMKPGAWVDPSYPDGLVPKAAE